MCARTAREKPQSPEPSVLTSRACVRGQLWPLGLEAALEGSLGRCEAEPQEHGVCSPLVSVSLRKGGPRFVPSTHHRFWKDPEGDVSGPCL